MNTAHPSDAVMAAHYERVRDRLRTEAELYGALSASVQEHDDAFGTFGAQVAAAHTSAYDRLREQMNEMADDAQGLALDYRAHQNGTYVTLSPSVLL